MINAMNYAKKRFNIYLNPVDGSWSGPLDQGVPVMLLNGEEVLAADVALAIAFDDDSLDRSVDHSFDCYMDMAGLDDLRPIVVQALYLLHRERVLDQMEAELEKLDAEISRAYKFDPNQDVEPLLAPVGRLILRAAKYIKNQLSIVVDRQRYRA